MRVYDDLKQFEINTGYDTDIFISMPTHFRHNKTRSFAILNQLNGNVPTNLTGIIEGFDGISGMNSNIQRSGSQPLPSELQKFTGNQTILSSLSTVPIAHNLSAVAQPIKEVQDNQVEVEYSDIKTSVRVMSCP